MSSASALEHLVQAACDTGTGDAEVAAGTGAAAAAAAAAAPVQASQIQVLEIDAFSSVHDLIHAAILSSRGAASLKEVYEVCQRNGRIAYKRAGGSRLITSNEHWKSQIRHALYTSDRFERVPGNSDLWQVTPAYGSQQPQLVKVLVRADEGSGMAAQPLNLPTSPSGIGAPGGSGSGSAGPRAAGAAAGRSGASRRKGGASRTQASGERGSGGGKRGGKSHSASPDKAAAPKRSSRRAPKRRSPSYEESDEEEEEREGRSDLDLDDEKRQRGDDMSLQAAASPRLGRKASWQAVAAQGPGRAAVGAAVARAGLSAGRGGGWGGGAPQEQQQAPAAPAGLSYRHGDANPLGSGFSSSPGGSAGAEAAPPPPGTWTPGRRKRALQQQTQPQAAPSAAAAALALAPASAAARAAAYSPLSDGRAVGPAAVAAGVLSPSPRSVQPRSAGHFGSRGAAAAGGGSGGNGGRALTSPLRPSGMASYSSFTDPAQLRWGATGVRSTLQPPTAESLLGKGSSAAPQATAQTAPQPRRQAASAEADSPPLAEAKTAAHRAAAMEDDAADGGPAMQRRAMHHEHLGGPPLQHAKHHHQQQQQAGRAVGLVALTPSQLERPAVPELHPSPLPSPVVASPSMDVWSSAMRGYLPAVITAQHPQQQQQQAQAQQQLEGMGMPVRAAHPGMLLRPHGGMAAVPFASFVPPFFQAGPGLVMAAPAGPYYAHQLMQTQQQQQQMLMQEALLAAQQAEQTRQPGRQQRSREPQQQQQWCTGTSQQPMPGDVPKHGAP